MPMCMALYLFTNNTVSEIEYDQARPGMHIQPAVREWESAVWEWRFPQKNIYYIGSYMGCGCGWGLPPPGENGVEESDVEAMRKDRESLARLLRGRDFTGSRLVLCWEGDQGAALQRQIPLCPEQLRDVRFEIEVLVEYFIVS